VQVAGAAQRVAIKFVAGVEDLEQRIRDGHIGWVLSGRMIKRSGDAMCDLHHARVDDERRFLG
jgi:hypothetical protein